MKIYNGRPSDIFSREEREVRVYDFLASIGIEYERCDHAPALTMEDCRAIVEASHKAKGKFMVGQVCRMPPGFIKAKELMISTIGS